MRKVFLDNLPTYEYNGRTNIYDWGKSIGYSIKFIYDDVEGEVKITDYDNLNKKLTIEYLDGDFKIGIKNFKKCKLWAILVNRTNSFKIELFTNFKDDKRDITITDREYRIVERKDGKGQNRKWYKYTCNKCGWTEGWMEEWNLKAGNGCVCCGIRPQVIVQGINDIPTTAPELVKFFQGGYDEAKLYTKGSSQKIKPICPDCGTIKDSYLSINSNLNSIQSKK